MKLDAKLKDLIDHASAVAEKNFRKDGSVYPVWLAHDRSDNLMVVPPPTPLHDSESKDLTAALVRALFELSGVTRYCFVCESWFISVDDVPEIDLDLIEREGTEKHPGRREVVIFNGESDATGFVFAYREISRPRGQKPRLGPLKIEQRFGGHLEGRFVSMLPNRGRSQ